MKHVILTLALLGAPSWQSAMAQPATSSATPDSTRRPSVLEVVPGNAWAVLSARDWPSVSSRSAGLIPGIDRLKHAAWIVDGIDETAEGAIAFLPFPATAEPASAMLLILPVENPASLMTLWSPRPVNGAPDITAVKIHEREAFVTIRHGYAMIALDRNTLYTAASGPNALAGKLDPVFRRASASADLFAWLDPRLASASGLRSDSMPILNKSGILSRLFTGSFFASLQGVAASVTFNEGLSNDAVSIDVLLKPRTFNDVAFDVTDRSLLSMLPDDQSVFASGFVSDARGVFDRMLSGQVTAWLASSGTIAPDQRRAWQQQFEDLGRQCRAGALGLYRGGITDHHAVCLVLEAERSVDSLVGAVKNLVGFVQQARLVDARLGALGKSLVYETGSSPADSDTVTTRFAAKQSPPQISRLARFAGQESLTFRVQRVDRYLLLTWSDQVFHRKAVETVSKANGRLAVTSGISKRTVDVLVIPELLAEFMSELGSAANTADVQANTRPGEGASPARRPVSIQAAPNGNMLRWRVEMPRYLLEAARDGA